MPQPNNGGLGGVTLPPLLLPQDQYAVLLGSCTSATAVPLAAASSRICPSAVVAIGWRRRSSDWFGLLGSKAVGLGIEVQVEGSQLTITFPLGDGKILILDRAPIATTASCQQCTVMVTCTG